MPDFTQKINEIFADAYHAAALQEADMQAFAAALEPIPKRWSNLSDTLKIRAALDTACGGNRDQKAEKALLQLRERFISLQKHLWVEEFERTLQLFPAEAWGLFLARYVETLSFWRTRLAGWWVDCALGETPENKKPWFPKKADFLGQMQEKTHFMEQRRWPEAYSFLRELAVENVLSPKLRAHLWAVCGSIQLYYNTLPDAKSDLAEAKKLAPELPYLAVTYADLERVSGNFERSREILNELLASNPNDPEALDAIGRSFSEEKNWEEAERWFDAVIAADPGNASGHRDKMALLGKNEEIYKKRKGEIPELVRLANLADPESELSNLLEAGYACQGSGDLKTAVQWFEKALAIEPERTETLLAIGFLHQTQKEYDKAEKLFEKVRRLAPASTDGYWYLAGLRNEEGKFVEAAEWFERAIPHCPMFARTLPVKAAEMYVAAGDLEKAAASCLEVLKKDPAFDFALNTLHDIADKLRDKGYGDGSGMQSALDLLEKIRKIKDELYEASFQNRSGNVYYYFSDYEPAAKCYRLAIAADAKEAVYHDNLAGALQKLGEQKFSIELFSEALQAARTANQLQPSNSSYRQQRARIEHKIKSLRHFGMLPEERTADIASLRVRFREELYPMLVKDNDLTPELMQKIENLREQFKKAYGISIPGVRFSTDWNLASDANFVLDLDGIPLQQGWLTFGPDAQENGIDTLVSILEQQIQFNLADLIHYDSPEISPKFVGKSATYAAGFFQIIRMLLRQKIAINSIDIIHEIYDEGLRSGKSIQVIAQDVRCHSKILPALPLNTANSRNLAYLPLEQEQYLLSKTGKSSDGQLLWQIQPSDPVFFKILDYLPQFSYLMGGHGEFVITQNPLAATLLNDLSPGTFFSQSEILNFSETEQAAILKSFEAPSQN